MKITKTKTMNNILQFFLLILFQLSMCQDSYSIPKNQQNGKYIIVKDVLNYLGKIETQKPSPIKNLFNKRIIMLAQVDDPLSIAKRLQAISKFKAQQYKMQDLILNLKKKYLVQQKVKSQNFEENISHSFMEVHHQIKSGISSKKNSSPLFSGLFSTPTTKKGFKIHHETIKEMIEHHQHILDLQEKKSNIQNSNAKISTHIALNTLHPLSQNSKLTKKPIFKGIKSKPKEVYETTVKNKVEYIDDNGKVYSKKPKGAKILSTETTSTTIIEKNGNPYVIDGGKVKSIQVNGKHSVNDTDDNFDVDAYLATLEI